MRFAVEAWAPGYGASAADPEAELDESAVVERSIEVPEGSWHPIAPPAGPAACVVFVDGIQRVDAQVWLTEDGGELRPGLCATYAAGAVRCDGRATVTDVRVERGLFTAARGAQPIETRHGVYALRSAGGDVAMLAVDVIGRMRGLEAEVAADVGGADLVVLDGLLWGREGVPHAVGYVKSHRKHYLPAELNAVVEALRPGQRTPVFLLKTGRRARFSWYVRLPQGGDHPWGGIVRCEASNELAPHDAAARADLTAATLPRFASSPHKDPRAPQNLYPIAGLERELRRRSGDQALLFRALMAAAAGRTPTVGGRSDVPPGTLASAETSAPVAGEARAPAGS